MNVVLAILAMSHRMSISCRCDYCAATVEYANVKRYDSYLRSMLYDDVRSDVLRYKMGMGEEEFSNYAACQMNESVKRIRNARLRKDSFKMGCSTAAGVEIASRLNVPGARMIYRA